jgi:tRNA A37 methylthiotransferase MiaB
MPLIESPVCSNIESFRKEHPSLKVSFHDQYIKAHITEGCIRNCSYCSEKIAFPEFKSFNPEIIIAGCKKAIETTKNLKILFIGDDVGDYGVDINYSLPQLIENLFGISKNIEIGIQFIHPSAYLKYINYYEKLLFNKKIFNLCIPIQSASNSVLKRMKRDYCEDDIKRIFNGLKNAGFVELETHLIVGFPGETEHDFQQSLDFCLKYVPKYVLFSQFLDTPYMEAHSYQQKIPIKIIQNRIDLGEKKMKEAGIIVVSENKSHISLELDKQIICSFIN